MSDTFDRTRLSQRENEILDLAIEGMTDQQIALRLEISTSTVNSYWVRVRGKLGHLSRTELVATALRDKSRHELSQLQAESDRFQELAQRRATDDENVASSEIFRAILEALPDPMIAVDGEGVILFANSAMEDLFGYSPRELVGESVEILLIPRDRMAHRAKIARYVRQPHPLRLGIGKVVYGRRKDGHLVRVSLALDGRTTSRGVVTTCVIRNFMDEIDLARRRSAAVVESLLHSVRIEEERSRTDLR